MNEEDFGVQAIIKSRETRKEKLRVLVVWFGCYCWKHILMRMKRTCNPTTQDALDEDCTPCGNTKERIVGWGASLPEPDS
jgi:hypothetical protein